MDPPYPNADIPKRGRVCGAHPASITTAEHGVNDTPNAKEAPSLEKPETLAPIFNNKDVWFALEITAFDAKHQLYEVVWAPSENIPAKYINRKSRKARTSRNSGMYRYNRIERAPGKAERYIVYWKDTWQSEEHVRGPLLDEWWAKQALNNMHGELDLTNTSDSVL